MDQCSTPKNRGLRISGRRADDGDRSGQPPRAGGLVLLFLDLCGEVRTGSAGSRRGVIPLGSMPRAPGQRTGGPIVALGGVGLAVYAA